MTMKTFTLDGEKLDVMVPACLSAWRCKRGEVGYYEVCIGCENGSMFDPVYDYPYNRY